MSSKLSMPKRDRQWLRSTAKQFVAIMSDALGHPVEVQSQKRIKFIDCDFYINCTVQQLVEGYKCESNFPLRYSELKRWSELSESDRYTIVYRFAEHFKSCDRRLAENIDSIKADLECIYNG